MVSPELKEEIGKTFESGTFQVDNEKILLMLIEVIKSLLSNLDPSLKMGKITAPNFILQQILSSHASLSRYPKEEYNPLTKYAKGHFLIKHYNKIYSLQKDCLDECFKFIS